MEEQELARGEAERLRRGLTIFTDGSRINCGAAGYAVVWKNPGQQWVGIKDRMGCNQELLAQSARHWQGRWRLRQGGRLPRNKSRSLRTPRQLPGAWSRRDLFTDERYTRPILGFLRTIKMGRRVDLGGVREEAQS